MTTNAMSISSAPSTARKTDAPVLASEARRGGVSLEEVAKAASALGYRLVRENPSTTQNTPSARKNGHKFFQPQQTPQPVMKAVSSLQGAQEEPVRGFLTSTVPGTSITVKVPSMTSYPSFHTFDTYRDNRGVLPSQTPVGPIVPQSVPLQSSLSSEPSLVPASSLPPQPPPSGQAPPASAKAQPEKEVKPKKPYPSAYKILCDLMAKQYSWRDKILKEALLCCDFTRLIMKDFKGNPSTIEGFEIAKDAMGKARSCFGLLNIFDHAIPDVINASENAYHHAQMISNDEYAAKYAKDRGNTEAYQKDLREHPTDGARSLGYMAQLMKVIERICFIVCFGVLNPIRFADECAKGSLSKSAKAIGKTFCYFWMGVHVASFASNMCDFIRKGFCVDPTGDWSEDMKELTMKLTENICDLLCDIIVIAALVTVVHGYVTLSLSLFATTIGLYRLWNKTAISYMEGKV